MRWMLLVVPLLACQAQELPADLVLLAKIKARMAENFARLPNYTCSEQIERSARSSTSRKMKPLDTVRLEVALVDGKELYGWPGSHQIAESELSRLVGGTIGNGDFALLARSIFQSQGGVQFTYRGDTNLDGKPAIQFDFNVPLLSSAYHLKSGANEVVVPYHGSIWLHPDSLDLSRVQIIADEIPDYLGIAACTKVLDYRRTRIGATEFLLPSAAKLGMVDYSGFENHNQSRFHSCRQYSGESVLSFDDPTPSADEPEKVEVRQVDLPEEFEADLSLVTPINSNTAAVGDEIQVKLQRNLKSWPQHYCP